MQNNPYTLQRLRDYALWYYFRYYPSNKKLLQKLSEKGREEDAQKVFQDIKHLLQEENIIASKIDNYIFLHKNYRYIRQKMMEKGFPKEYVENYLQKYKENGESLLGEDYLRKKIEAYLSKGKSQRYIQQKLGETPEDREILEKVFLEYFSDGEKENILREYEKIKGKYSKEKIIQKLIAKGFRYDDIKRSLDT